jgi:hypothetical protein
MRFYVPEWDDRVDADYDFVHDEHSTLGTDERDLAYIWDIFDRQSTPIDGVLISREQAESNTTKADRLTANGIYDAPNLDVPDWLPTISDCGAWGYKSLPFPPYDNGGMLEFYEQLGVTTGVTIDHLVLGAGHTSRLYLDERAFGAEVSKSDVPEELAEEVDVMIDTWPSPSDRSNRTWPEYVADEEPSIYGVDDPTPFTPADFDGDVPELLDRFETDPRAVYRDDDMQYRYDRTLENAIDMLERYEAGDYSFRLMAAVQGWDASSYVEAIEQTLDAGYQYLGIGGLAGSRERTVRDVVAAVGNAIKRFERERTTRIDTHLFGFAKTGAFDRIGRSGITSFDSASMLRSAWTGGKNYHLDADERYDAIRVRYPTHRDDLETAVAKALRGQELLYALRAFDADESIADALETWIERAREAYDGIESYLRTHRHDSRFDVKYVQEAEGAFRDGYEHGRAFRANFGDPVSSRLVKLLRDDDPEDPLPFAEYARVLEAVESVFDGWSPTNLPTIEDRESEDPGSLSALWPLVEAYATWSPIGDDELLEEYRRLLLARPWERCRCPICVEHGIEVAIFRGNNRNRRRGFHNTRRFYDQFEEDLPKILVVTRASASLMGGGTIEEYLRSDRPAFWEAVHDLPVAEIGAVSADGLHEWATERPSVVSLGPERISDALVTECERYQDVVVDERNWSLDENDLRASLDAVDCSLHLRAHPEAIRECVLDRLGYENEFLPEAVLQSGLTDY